MKHSILPPSSASIWGKPGGCTGSIKMAQKYKQEDSEAALKGQAAHELSERMLKGDFKAEFSKDGVLFDDEMIEAAKLYIHDICRIVLINKQSISDLKIEHKVICKIINDLSFGTVDAFLHHENNLYIWDLKYGHAYVDVYENWQMINYAAGLKTELNLSDDTKVNFRIVQPRSYHDEGPIRNWRITIKKLQPYFNQLRDAATQALSTQATLQTGNHCKYCPARHACTTALNAGISLYELSSSVESSELGPKALGLQLDIVKRALEQLKCIESGLEEQVKFIIKSSKNVPGWTMKPSKGRKQWDIDVKKVIKLGEYNGFDLKKPNDVITPTQAIKLGLHKEIIDPLCSAKNNGMKLAKDEDNAAIKIFGEIE